MHKHVLYHISEKRQFFEKVLA